ncbi:MAG: phosphopantetheine-binding protein [Phocaeicola sp.]|nr:phosphopantetheine-binding protein [Phocaeicola sp.]
MTRNEIIEQVNALLAEEFEVEEAVLTEDADIKDALALDSLSLVDLVALIQQTYGVKIPAADLHGIKTLGNLYDYIEKHLPEK